MLSPRSRQDGAGFFLQDLTPARTELAGPTVDRCEGSKASKDEDGKPKWGCNKAALLSQRSLQKQESRLVVPVSISTLSQSVL